MPSLSAQPFRQFLSLLALSGALLSLPANAITNIENERPGPPKEGWSGQVEVGLSGQNGNQEKEHYRGAGKITWRAGDTTAFALAERAYGETFGIKDTDETFLHLRGIHQLDPRFAAEAFVQWQQDDFDNLSARALLGGGGRYELFNQPEVVTLSLGLGAFREKEELDLGTFTDTDWAWRGNSYVAYRHQINPQLRVVGTTYYQPNLEAFDDYRILFDFGLVVAIYKSLSLKMSYALTHNSEPAVNLQANPPINKSETNTSYATSLVYTF